jgi:protocatechuate 3,4-dioxygenase beta subunit
MTRPCSIDRREAIERLALVPLAMIGASLPGCTSSTAASKTSQPLGGGDADSGGTGGGRGGADGAATGPDAGATDAASKQVIDASGTTLDATGKTPDAIVGVDGGASSKDAAGADTQSLNDKCSTKIGDKPDDNPPSPCLKTGADLQGPFYSAGATTNTVLAGPKEPGERLTVTGRIYAAGCKLAIAGVHIDVWQADAKGAYRDLSHATPLRATMTSDCNGRFSFDTVLPGAYLDNDGYRPRHIHMTITPKGGTSLTTQLYFAGDPYLAPNDSCGVCHSEDKTHIVPLTTATKNANKHHVAHFDVVL